MTVTLQATGAPIGPEHVAALEQRIGQGLPGDYRQFLLDVNGGEPEVNYYPPAEDLGVSVRDFFQLGSDDRYISLETHLDVYAGRVPPDFLPVANDDGGDLICLSLRDHDYGRVYLWDHNWESNDDEPPTDENLHPVAASFTEFYRGLEPYSAAT